MKKNQSGLPPTIDPEHLSRMYDGVEYREFWNESSKRRLDKLEKLIIQDLLPVSGFRIIDIGCGFGRLSSCYIDRFEQVIMLDGSITLLQQAQDVVGEKAIYIAADANRLPFGPSSFDCVLMIRVLHHIQDSQNIFNELQRVICNGGYLIFDYCNKMSANQIIRRGLFMTHENPFSIKPTGIGTRLVSLHPNHVVSLLKQHGFTNLKCLGVGVLDKIPDPKEHLIPLAKALAPLFGLISLAPWINYRAMLVNPAVSKQISYNIDDILICPTCHHNLDHQSHAYYCPACNTSFPITNGILDFRPT